MRWRNKATGAVMPFQCKSWTCPDCGPETAKHYRWKIGAWAEHYDLSRFLTLTLDLGKARRSPWARDIMQAARKAGLNPGARDFWVWFSWKYIKGSWNRFLTNMRRQYPDMKYIAIMEPHDSDRTSDQMRGIFHLHIVLNRYIPWQTIDKYWEMAGGGNFKIKKVDIKRIRIYLSKYVTKVGESDKSWYPKRSRHVTSSRGVLLRYEPRQLNLEPGSDVVKADLPWKTCFPGDDFADCGECAYKRECRTLPPQWEILVNGTPIHGPPVRYVEMEVLQTITYPDQLFTTSRRVNRTLACAALPENQRPCRGCLSVPECRAMNQSLLPERVIDRFTGDVSINEGPPDYIKSRLTYTDSM